MQNVIFCFVQCLCNVDKCTNCYLCGTGDHPTKRGPSKSN